MTKGKKKVGDLLMSDTVTDVTGSRTTISQWGK